MVRLAVAAPLYNLPAVRCRHLDNSAACFPHLTWISSAFVLVGEINEIMKLHFACKAFNRQFLGDPPTLCCMLLPLLRRLSALLQVMPPSALFACKTNEMKRKGFRKGGGKTEWSKKKSRVEGERLWQRCKQKC